tara:strand:- start:1427 stop:2293 length:867 start_codon:yes stop_codon:yes gene_type:complete
MKKILLLGGAGFLGTNLSKTLKNRFILIKQSRKKKKNFLKFDPKNIKLLKKVIFKYSPDLIINLIAETNVDKCEKNLKIAKSANVLVNKNLVKIYKNSNKKFFVIYISTDQVYSKRFKNKEPEVLAINNYAKTKLKGESIIKEIPSAIIRTNFFGKHKIKKNKKHFLDWVYRSLKNKDHIIGFNNMYFNPLHISTLSKILLKFCQTKLTGTYNVGSKNIISKGKFILFFSKKINIVNKNLLIKDYKLKKNLAPRPLYMGMNVSKIERKLNIRLPKIENEIKKGVNEFK